MDFGKLAITVGAIGALSLAIGVGSWMSNNPFPSYYTEQEKQGYSECLYSSSFMNRTQSLFPLRCQDGTSFFTPPLFNGVGVALLLVSFAVAIAARK